MAATEDEARLEAAWHEARQTWPGTDVGVAELAAYAEARRGADGALPQHLTDLYLACAAARGDAAALHAFDARVLADVIPAVRSIARDPAAIEDVRQSVRVRLLVGDGDEPPRITAYSGRGPLRAWVRVTAVRAALNAVRGARPTVCVEHVIGELAAADPDPETRHLRDTYRAEYATALRDALAELQERPRALLRLHFVDGMRLARIGALYRVHESTASRWVRAALDEVADRARALLVSRLALTGSAVDSIARMVRSGLDLSLRALLDDSP